MIDFEKISELIIELEVDDIADAVKEALDEGKDPYDILNALTSGMDEVGKRYEEDVYYLAELVLAGETMKEAFSVLKPAMAAKDDAKKKDKVVIGTVKGDNHDIGKNLLGTLLLSSGFEVIDMGMDVEPKDFVAKAKETGAKIIGLSSLLTMTVNQISEVDKVLKEEGMRDKIKIIVGGAPLNIELAKKLGADDFAADAVDGIRHIKALLSTT